MSTAKIAPGAKSQNGMKVLPSDSKGLHTWTIPLKGGTLKIKLRAGYRGFILACLIIWWDRHIEPVHQKQLDDWGHAVRPIRGQRSGYSNHASGTAEDINATKHPRGVPAKRTFSVKQLTLMKAMQKRSKGAIEFGAFWTKIPDGMHIELTDAHSTHYKFYRLIRFGGVRRKGWKSARIILAANPWFK